MNGRRGLDTAEGILIALLRCTPDEAFEEIVAAAKRRQVPIFTLADALIETVTGRADCADAVARNAVQAEWGSLLALHGLAAE